jgi:hypothetical protein
LLTPAKSGLWSFDLLSFTMRPAAPNYIQGESIERLRGEVTAVGASGPYGFVAQRQVSAASAITSVGYEVVRYDDRISVHDMIPTTSTNEVIVDYFPFYDTTTRRTLLYYLVHNESTDSIIVRYKPLRLPNDQHVAGTGLSTASIVNLSNMAGPTPAANMTKVWNQIRGDWYKGSSGSAVLGFTGFKIDGSAVTLGSVSTSGPFSIDFTGTAANRLGRELTAGVVTLTNPVYDTRVDFPLTLDFVWVPSTQDALTIKVLVSAEVTGRVASLWRRAPWAQAKVLLALRNTVTTLIFPEGDSWTVFVEGVSIGDIKEPDGAGQRAREATVQMRRLA